MKTQPQAKNDLIPLRIFTPPACFDIISPRPPMIHGLSSTNPQPGKQAAHRRSIAKTRAIYHFQDCSDCEKNDVQYIADHHVPLVGVKEAEEWRAQRLSLFRRWLRLLNWFFR